jgi:dTDP-4-dehydrorhamnose 3,5-epimerase
MSETPLPGVQVLERQPIADARGWLERMFDADELRPIVGDRSVVAVNRTLTSASGTVRGMHFQVPPSAEAKVVSCLRGEVFDVAVDVRRASPTFLRWHAERLTADNRRSLFIPEGVAHGFQALTDDAELLYLHTASHDPAAERGIHPLDPRIGIEWPMAVENLSARDAGHPLLDDRFEGIEP